MCVCTVITVFIHPHHCLHHSLRHWRRYLINCKDSSLFARLLEHFRHLFHCLIFFNCFRYVFTVLDICSLFQIFVHYLRYMFTISDTFFLLIYIFNCIASLFHRLQGCFAVVYHYFYCSASFFSILYILHCFASLLHHLSIFSLFYITIFTVLHGFPSLQIIFQLCIIIMSFFHCLQSYFAI